MAQAQKRVLDFTNVKEAGAFNPKHKPAGEYLATITDVSEEKSSKGNEMWTFTVVLKKDPLAKYPHRCTLNIESLWKVRNLLVATGKQVPKKKLNVDPKIVVGKDIGVVLSDEEYEGKMKSIIDGVFPAADMPADETKKSSKAKPAEGEGVEDEDVEDEEVTEEDTEVMDVDDL